MLRLMFVIAGLMVIGLLAVSERQRSVNVGAELGRLHRQMQDVQTELWQQQVQLATMTSPRVLEKILSKDDRRHDEQN